MKHVVSFIVLVAVLALPSAALADDGDAGELAQAEPGELVRAEPGEVIAFRVEGRGWGHGVGMSQYSALNRALAGHTHEAILGFSYPGTTLGPDGAPVASLRVRVGIDQRSTRIVPSGRLAVYGSRGRLAVVDQPVTITRRNGAFVVRADDGTVVCATRRPALTCGRTVGLRWRQGAQVRVEQATGVQTYRWGSLQVRRVSGLAGFQTIVSRLTLDRYLYGLAEVPSSWPGAALRAQAIAGRSYATATVRARRAAPGWVVPWDLESGTSDQVYLGAAIELAGGTSWVQAVDATSGVVVRGAAGVSVSTNYSSSNGGYAASSAYVWGSPNSWLVDQPDPFDAPNPNSRWTRVYTRAEIRRWVIAAGHPDPGRVDRIVITGNVGVSGRMQHATVAVRGKAGRVVLTGQGFINLVIRGLGADGTLDGRTILSSLLTIHPVRA